MFGRTKQDSTGNKSLDLAIKRANQVGLPAGAQHLTPCGAGVVAVFPDRIVYMEKTLGAFKQSSVPLRQVTSVLAAVNPGALVYGDVTVTGAGIAETFKIGKTEVQAFASAADTARASLG